MSRKTIGLTLLTLVIISILFAVTWVEYSRAKVQINVARVNKDFENISQALMSYSVDWNCRPPPDINTQGEKILPHILVECIVRPGPLRHYNRRDHRVEPPYPKHYSETTVQFMEKIPTDPFNQKGNGSYHYVLWQNNSYIISSYGPDEVDGYGTTKFDSQHYIFDPWDSDTSYNSGLCVAPFPLKSSPFTYDPTNGLRSPGDIWRRGP